GQGGAAGEGVGRGQVDRAAARQRQVGAAERGVEGDGGAGVGGDDGLAQHQRPAAGDLRAGGGARDQQRAAGDRQGHARVDGQGGALAGARHGVHRRGAGPQPEGAQGLGRGGRAVAQEVEGAAVEGDEGGVGDAVGVVRAGVVQGQGAAPADVHRGDGGGRGG